MSLDNLAPLDYNLLRLVVYNHQDPPDPFSCFYCNQGQSREG